MKTLSLLMAIALGLSMSAQAHLGWTMDQCWDRWGTPTENYDSSLDKTVYNFRVQSNLSAQIYVLNGYVQCVSYCSQDPTFLLKNANRLLQENHFGTWVLYDDVQGKKTLKTWRLLDENSQMVAYAMLYTDRDQEGFYHLTVSSSFWSDFLNKVRASI